jgi:hypothetical protein
MYSIFYDIFHSVPIIGFEIQKKCDISANVYLQLTENHALLEITANHYTIPHKKLPPLATQYPKTSYRQSLHNTPQKITATRYAIPHNKLPPLAAQYPTIN